MSSKLLEDASSVPLNVKQAAYIHIGLYILWLSTDSKHSSLAVCMQSARGHKALACLIKKGSISVETFQYSLSYASTSAQQQALKLRQSLALCRTLRMGLIVHDIQLAFIA